MSPQETEERLAAIAARLKAATQQQWYVDGTCGDDLAVRFAPDDAEEDTDDAKNVGSIVAIVPPPNEDDEAREADAELIANAPADLAWLLSELTALQEEVARKDEIFRWLLGEEDVFPSQPEGLSLVIREGIKAIRAAGGESKPVDRPLFWWRLALRNRIAAARSEERTTNG